jgi:hypothetical protein
MKVRSLVTLTLALTAGSVWAQSESSYRMKEADTHVGTNIKKDASYSQLPFDKGFAQLTEAQQNIVKSYYVSMGPGDEPPFPEAGLAKIFGALQQVHSRLQEEGYLDLGVMVDAQGVAKSIKVYATPDQQVARAMANVLVLQKYKPALCKGQPCEQEFPLRVNLKLTR